MTASLCAALPLEPGQAQRLLLFSRWDSEVALNGYCEAEALVRQQAGLPPPAAGVAGGATLQVRLRGLGGATRPHAAKGGATPRSQIPHPAGRCMAGLCAGPQAEHRVCHLR